MSCNTGNFTNLKFILLPRYFNTAASVCMCRVYYNCDWPTLICFIHFHSNLIFKLHFNFIVIRIFSSTTLCPSYVRSKIYFLPYLIFCRFPLYVLFKISFFAIATLIFFLFDSLVLFSLSLIHDFCGFKSLQFPVRGHP